MRGRYRFPLVAASVGALLSGGWTVARATESPTPSESSTASKLSTPSKLSNASAAPPIVTVAPTTKPSGAKAGAPKDDFVVTTEPSEAAPSAPSRIPPGLSPATTGTIAKPDAGKSDDPGAGRGAYATRLDEMDRGSTTKSPPQAPAASSAIAPAVASTSDSDSAPGRAPAAIGPAPAAAPAKLKPRAATKHPDDGGIDPEPDVAITPPPAPVAPEPVEARPPAEPLEAPKPAVQEEPLPPLNAAIKAALDKRDAAEIHGANAGERRREREAIAFFYAAHAFAPAWSADGVAVPAVGSVLARLAHAGDDALTPPATPASLRVTGTLDEIADSDLALSEAVVAYARQATGSRIEPRTIAPLIGFKPDLADATDVLESVAAAGSDAGDRLRAFNPSEPRYVALREKLAQLREARAPMSASTIPAGPDLRVGMSDPRVPLIRARFSLDGTPDSPPRNLRYDTEVAAAVAGFQRANGLPASGVLTRRTIAALSGGHPSRLEGDLIANMEMWRWMPRDLGADRIEVNVPDFVVTVYQGGAPISRNRVVVGKNDTPTPLFSNKMKYLIVNPVWNVPDSIVKKEMLPKLAADPRYLSRLGYTAQEMHGRLVVRQPSGPKNALGRIKFMFPNDYAVYLHDTPSKSLFSSARRAFSHGCVRVDQPFLFAESVLGSRKGWSEKRLLGMLGDTEHYVNLPTPLPIHIEYFTATVDASGHLDLRDDVYDYVHKVAQALGQEG